MNFPKVLILNQPFNNHTGGGITLSNLFSGWDKDKIAVVCYKYLLENIDTNMCNTYYQLGYKESKFAFPFNILKRKHGSGQVKFDKIQNQDTIGVNRGIRVNLIMRYFIPFLKYFGFINGISKIELSIDLRDWLRNFNPDIIYAQSSNREGLKLISLVHSYLKKPVVFHMMDDWLGAEKGPFQNIVNKKNDHEFRKLINNSNLLLSISDGMADEYKQRYGKTFITYHNPINIEFWEKHQRNSYELSNCPSILYAGRVGLGIDSSLELIAKAVQCVNNALNLSIKFKLQTKERPAWISDYKCAEHVGFFSYNELPKKFSIADILILPYDFSLHSIQFIRYSMPTKATEYMISGTPIILFAPKETSIVEYAKKYNWAYIVTENDIISLSEGIKYLIQNNSVRQEIALNAIKTAKENHASSRVATNFRKAISSLIG